MDCVALVLILFQAYYTNEIKRGLSGMGEFHVIPSVRPWPPRPRPNDLDPVKESIQKCDTSNTEYNVTHKPFINRLVCKGLDHRFASQMQTAAIDLNWMRMRYRIVVTHFIAVDT